MRILINSYETGCGKERESLLDTVDLSGMNCIRRHAGSEVKDDIIILGAAVPD